MKISFDMPVGIDDISFSHDPNKKIMVVRLRKFVPTTVYSCQFNYPMALIHNTELLNIEIQRSVHKIKNQELRDYENK